MSDDRIRQMLIWRGVEDPCQKCGGSGVRVYGSTATWRGGIGGCAMTADVCDACWGSGDEHRRGADLRAMEAAIRQARATARLNDLAASCGAELRSFQPALEAVCAELDRLQLGRKERPRFFADACSLVARVLREGMIPTGPGVVGS